MISNVKIGRVALQLELLAGARKGLEAFGGRGDGPQIDKN